MDFGDYDDNTTADTDDDAAIDTYDSLSEAEDAVDAEFVTDDLDGLIEDAGLDLSTTLDVELEDEAWLEDLPGLTEEMLAAISKDADKRDYHETELADIALHRQFASQRSIATDSETGLAVCNESGDFVECSRNTKGAQRPDAMLVDETGVHLREAKNYSSLNNLKQNIKHQTEDRRTAFGYDVDLTYVVAPNFTIEEAMKLQSYVEDKLGVNLEWQLR